MVLTSYQNRLLMMHEWLLGSNATVASERINLTSTQDSWKKYGVLMVQKVSTKEKWQEVIEAEGEYFEYQFCLCSGVIGA
ncbi:hypothetical protein KIN20_024660 [Parelaphostrongylus tenuis]|uniref:Uncharacterized protein n=1 Tax=Parelaphostrongylus tenuis TaxID=148309 RepID=A0AAD5N8E1_PARTN|nr:hypothetical protein KIN20_024660 [Parelaphostrongylus tenuis]